MFSSHYDYYYITHEPRPIEHWDEKQRSWASYKNQKGQGWSKKIAKRKKKNKVAKKSRKMNRR